MGFSRQESCSGWHSLLQGIFPTQGLTLGLPHCRQILYHLKNQLSSVQSLSHVRIFVTHGFLHAGLPWTSPNPRAYSNSCPSHQWCHPTVSSSVICFSSLQSFPASGSFPVSQLFPSDGRSNGVSASASVPPMNIWDWFPSGSTGLISLKSKELLRVFSNTTVQKNQFFGAQLSK